jgi:hypothetical protein
MPPKGKATTNTDAKDLIDTDLVPLSDAAPDDYVEDPNYDPANDEVNPDEQGDLHPDMGERP